jgi:hypothetical protein
MRSALITSRCRPPHVSVNSLASKKIKELMATGNFHLGIVFGRHLFQVEIQSYPPASSLPSICNARICAEVASLLPYLQFFTPT